MKMNRRRLRVKRVPTRRVVPTGSRCGSAPKKVPVPPSFFILDYYILRNVQLVQRDPAAGPEMHLDNRALPWADMNQAFGLKGA